MHQEYAKMPTVHKKYKDESEESCNGARYFKESTVQQVPIAKRRKQDERLDNECRVQKRIWDLFWDDAVSASAIAEMKSAPYAKVSPTR